MITVDCSDAKPIKNKLLIFVADRLGVMPILKLDKFVLTSLDDSQTVKKSVVLAAIEEFLESKKLAEDVQVIPKDDTLIIKPREGKELKENSVQKKELFFECTHCGFMTLYEEELRTHKLIHYI